jgi:hypothetical protein
MDRDFLINKIAAIEKQIELSKPLLESKKANIEEAVNEHKSIAASVDYLLFCLANSKALLQKHDQELMIAKERQRVQEETAAKEKAKIEELPTEPAEPKPEENNTNVV